MQNIIELFVSGNTSSGTTGGQIETFGDEPLVINYSVKDIKEFTSTNSNYSFSFKVPGTKNNNILFSNLFEIGVDSNFDPRKKARAYILVNSIPILVGNIQLLTIDVKDKNNITYDFTIFGETANLRDAIGDSYLTDIDFSELNHTLSWSSVANSWSGSSSLGYYYPLIDYGYNFTSVGLISTGVTVDQIFPALYTKYVVDKIFSAAGFTYTSNFFNTSAFTETIIPYNGSSDFTLNSTYSTAYTFNVQNGYNFEQAFSAYTNWNALTNPLSLEIYAPFLGANKTTGGYFDNGNGIQDIGFGINGYSAQTISAQRFTANMGWTLFASGNVNSPGFIEQYSPSAIGFKWFRSSYGGFSVPFHVDTPLSNPNWVPGSGYYYNKINNFQSITPWLDNPLSTNYYPVQQNEVIMPVAYIYDPQKNRSATGKTIYESIVPIRIYSAYTTFRNEVSLKRVSGMTVNYNDYVPKKIKQIDFLNSIIKMFNLYVQVDKNNPKNLIIEPRDIYYSSGITRTWVLDQNKSVTEALISEQQQKLIKFSYKDDKDYLNTHYKDVQNRVYGDYTFDIDNDFTKGDKTIDIIFSPTPNSAVGGTTDFILPQIYKLDTSNNYGRTDSNIRFLRKNPTLQNLSGSSWNMAGSTSGMTAYPYAGHISQPFGSGGTDYNFGAVPYVYYNHTGSYLTSDNLVNTYWLKYLNQIADKDSKLITCYVKLSPKDIQEFNFWDNVFITGINADDVGNYFLVNSIEYNPTINDSYKVELLKLKSVSVTYTPTVLDTTPTSTSSTLRSSLSVGGGKSLASGSISIGTANYNSASNSISVGDNSIIMPGAENSMILGSGSRIDSSAERSVIIGSNSFVDANSTDSFLIGSNSYVASGVTGVTIFGSGISASTSNTSYFNNIAVASGNYFNVATGGTNPTAGIVQLNPASSQATVTTNKIQDNTYVMLTVQSNGSGIVGSPYILTRTAGTSFTIQSNAVGDDSFIAWVLFQPY